MNEKFLFGLKTGSEELTVKIYEVITDEESQLD